MSFLWTSEAVGAGHPDKVADQIADAILDEYLRDVPDNRVACEVTCMKDLILVTGEVGVSWPVKVEDVVRKTVEQIGYDRPENGWNGLSVEILNKINEQSQQIAGAVVKDDGELGAGDQGLMFGFACNETEDFMPLAHNASFDLIQRMQNAIAVGRVAGYGGSNRDEDELTPWDSPLLPDMKTQVTVRYLDDGKPVMFDTILISVQHKPELVLNDLYGYIHEKVLKGFKQKYSQFWDEKRTKVLVNPAGVWTLGGPAADTGLSGRKIVVDNYGADCPIGGGSFSGKDPTKVDRSAAYAARHVAKNIVAAGLAEKVQVQLSYAIGVPEPVSGRVQTFGTSDHSDASLTEMVEKLVPLSPKAIIDRLDLRKPIYRATASGGHFGRQGFSWEKLDLVDKFKEYYV
ncbi:methionine adenosyltransferase [Phaeobacter italicus]|uniref:methionine adenosyltransferase n=1 Tax=Phaeobacter italicus TaxID=481446 RepID=UPI00248F45FF|nr:methionine adenosyltransferase [Phaeobacter italicus]